MKNGSIVLVWALFAVLAAPSLGLAKTKSPETVSTTVRAQVSKTDVSVRRAASSSSKEVAVAKKGSIVAVLSTSNGWANVRFSDGVSGWIHKSMLVFPEGEKSLGQPAKTTELPKPVSEETVLPETPTRIVSDTTQSKRLSISISEGKASIRQADGTHSEEQLPATAPVAEKPAAPRTLEAPVLKAKALDLPTVDHQPFPPLEAGPFAPAPKSAKASERPLKAEGASDSAAKVLDQAASMKGSIFYRYGGEGSRGGWDCSAFVRHCFAKAADITLPRTAMEQYSRGKSVSRSELQPGDLVFFSSRISRVGHVGIYWGDGKFIHCSSGKNGVAISGLSESYYASHYVGAKRILSGNQKLTGPIPLEDSTSGENN